MWKDLSRGLSESVQKAERFTLTVDGRHGYPSSGVAYDKKHVLTASHTIDRDEEISVKNAEGGESPGRVIGRDMHNDLALIELEKEISDAPKPAEEVPAVGQLVLALARPTDEGIQASLGIISIVGGRYRSWGGGHIEGVMRSDAERYPGFAGGPLIDVEGGLLGVNTYGFGRSSPLTIPAEKAWKIAETLLKEGSIKQGYLGIRSQPVNLKDPASLGRKQDIGLLVVDVEEGSPASKGGLLVGDIVTAIAGTPVESHDALLGGLAGETIGQPAEIEVIRGGSPMKLKVTVGEREQTTGRHQMRGCCGP